MTVEWAAPIVGDVWKRKTGQNYLINSSDPLCAVKGVSFQWVQFPPGKVSLQPVAIGAAVEVTKPPEPSV